VRAGPRHARQMKFIMYYAQFDGDERTYDVHVVATGPKGDIDYHKAVNVKEGSLLSTPLSVPQLGG